jgi:hypothetical protein
MPSLSFMLGVIFAVLIYGTYMLIKKIREK